MPAPDGLNGASRPDPRTEQAGRWVAARDRGDMTPDEHMQFDRWLKEDSRNVGAYVRAQAIYRTLDYTGSVSAAPQVPVTRDDADFGRRRLLYTAAACAAALLPRAVPPDRVMLLRRDHEAPRRYRWQDAVITLDALSAAYIPAFGGTSHGVRVLSGRVGVRTTRTTVRLSTGRLRMDAANADFDLSLDGFRPLLIAYSGAIALWDGDARTVLKGPALYHLPRAATTDAMAIAPFPLSPTAALTCRAWRDGQAVLNNTPVADAAAQFNRYSRTKILIRNDRIAQNRVTGSFDLLRPDEFARSVQQLLRCRMTEVGERIVLS